jgi:acyl dehydratase
VSSPIEVGASFGPSSWIEVPQEKIQAFADTTGDHNFIHVDPEMAAQTPFGGTVAHGYLTLSLLPQMSYEVLPHDDPGAGMALNYGLNKVRFPASVPSGSRVRGSFVVGEVDEQDWGRQVTMTATIEREGGDKPVCVAEVVYRYYLL